MAGLDTANFNGDQFEHLFDLRNVLRNNGYYVDETNGWVYRGNECIGIAAAKRELHDLIFKPMGIYMGSITGVQREPDDFFLNKLDSCLYIIEKKSQKSAGSKDNTIQAAVGRRQEYWAALENIQPQMNTFTEHRISTAMSYVLNGWYADDKYAWRLAENESHGIPMLIEQFPLSIIGLGNDGPVPMKLFPARQAEPSNQLDLGLF